MEIIGFNQFEEPIKVIIKAGKISEITKIDIDACPEVYIIPGFIENHSHGGYGFDWINNDQTKALDYLRKLALYEGTTTVVGTTITTKPSVIKRAIKANSELVNKPLNGANLIGFHLEGPFISFQKRGGHPEQYLMPFSLSNLEGLVGKNNIKYLKIITFAPEISTNEEVEKIYKKYSFLILQIGHTTTDLNLFKSYSPDLIKGITHFNNAMIKWGEPNALLVDWASKDRNIYIEFINDGIHNSYNLARYLYLNKPHNKVLLVTDSLHVKGLPNGKYAGPNWELNKEKGAVWTPEGKLNGSVYSLLDAFRDWVKLVGASIDEAVQVTSTNQANYLGLNKGKIAVGYDADIIVLKKKNLSVVKVLVNGREIY